MNLAMIADDDKKELMIQFCTMYKGILEKYHIFATGTTGKVIEESTGLTIAKLLPGKYGGIQQIMSKISVDEIDLVVLFKNPLSSDYNNMDNINILRLCDIRNLPIATNIVSAEILLHSLEKGELYWRNLL